MNEDQVKVLVEQFAYIEMQNYYIAGLLALVTVLFAGVIYYFKKDAEETRQSLISSNLLGQNNQKAIDLALVEIKHNREQTTQMLRILAEHTGANIGL